MALPGRLAAAASVLLASACSPFGGGEFVCAEDDQCSGGASAGQCEPDGRCSFLDDTCTTGRRYGDFAGNKSNTCIGGGSTIDAPALIDAPLIDSAIDAAIDAPIIPFCNPADATLAGCWQFEGNGTDGSGSNPTNTANTASGTFATGKVGMGLTLTAASVISAGDRATLETPNLTIEGWVRPTAALPASPARFAMLDNDGAYGVFINSTSVTCSWGTVVAAVALPLNTWTHIACTYDSTNGRIYINGVQAATAAAAAITAGNANGLVLGGNSPNGDALIGMIDQYRIWNVARTPAQICVAAELTTCP